MTGTGCFLVHEFDLGHSTRKMGPTAIHKNGQWATSYMCC
ncbi:uncharacterized protein G2W53_013434 [Senna tora]|uniref:Uncharacterized protein n=1 Tax=Senna tora TaxID=362788 RepID=A0A834U2F9_9FABA|nr:uncharacterized protein G2W53_013434 [Senna tora]